MAIAQTTQQITSTAKGAVRDWNDHAGDKCWTRGLAVSSLITGAVLLARGKRRPGLIAAAAGAAIAVLEHPKEINAFWNNLPRYIESGKNLVVRLESFVEDISAEGEKVRVFLENVADKRS